MYRHSIHMSLEQLKAFLQKAKDDPNLLDQLKKAESSEKVASIAKKHGHEFTANHVEFSEKFGQLAYAKFGQLSEEELETLAGGTSCSIGYTDPGIVVTTENVCKSIPKKS